MSQPDFKHEIQAACHDIYNNLELWSLEETKMEKNILYWALDQTDRIVFSNGQPLLPSAEREQKMQAQHKIVRQLLLDLTEAVVGYLTQPMDYESRPHTLVNKMAIIVRETAVAAESDAEDNGDDGEDEDPNRKHGKRHLSVLDSLRKLVKRSPEQVIKSPKSVTSFLSNQSDGSGGNRSPLSPSFAPLLARRNPKSKTKSAKQIPFKISAPIEILHSDHERDAIRGRDRTIIIDYRAQAESIIGLPLRDIRRMNEIDRKRETMLACLEIVLDHLPHMILERHPGPSTFGEGQYSADPSDVSRFHLEIQNLLVVTLTKMVPVGDHVLQYIPNDLLEHSRRRFQTRKGEVYSQHQLRYQPSFDVAQLQLWLQAELLPNMFDFATMASAPVPADVGDSLSEQRPSQTDRPRVTSACMLMTCFPHQRSAMLEHISERLAYLSKYRPAVTQPASWQEKDPHPQYIGLMLFLWSAHVRLMRLQKKMVQMRAEMEEIDWNRQAKGDSGARMQEGEASIGPRETASRPFRSVGGYADADEWGDNEIEDDDIEEDEIESDEEENDNHEIGYSDDENGFTTSQGGDRIRQTFVYTSSVQEGDIPIALRSPVAAGHHPPYRQPHYHHSSHLSPHTSPNCGLPPPPPSVQLRRQNPQPTGRALHAQPAPTPTPPPPPLTRSGTYKLKRQSRRLSAIQEGMVVTPAPPPAQPGYFY